MKKHDSDEEELYFGTKEEKPVVTAIIDERPLHMQKLDQAKWKAIGSENNDEDDQNKLSGQPKNDKQTLDGKRAGLSDAKEIKKELAELKRKNAKLLSKMDENLTGKNAKTVFRDRKTGKIRQMEKELKEKEEADREQAIKEAEKKAVYNRWSKGLVQREDQIEKIENDLHEMSKPLARYEDDTDLEKMLREREREDDPMLKEIRKKRDEEKAKEPGHKVYPKYNGPPPPANRFKILPGYRWDGVNRSNGYEAKYFNRISDREAIQEEAYHWSVQDM